MKASLLLLIGLFNFNFIIGQEVQNPEFQERLNTLLENNVPVYDVKTAYSECDEVLFLDARELEEYETSHIPNAKHIGYNHFKLSNLEGVAKNQKIIVYCSVGYRSEKLTNRLIKEGYSNVFNLYGSIFEWANLEYPLEDKQGNSTSKVHTYNKAWSKWVDHPNIVKVW